MRIISASVRCVGACVVCAVTLVAMAAFPQAVAAQTAGALPSIGTRIRVTSPALGDRPVTAIVLGTVRDSLLVRPDGTRDSLSLAIADIHELAVSNGKETHLLKGVGIGFLAGAGVGAIVGAVSYKPCRDSFACIGQPNNRGSQAAVGGILGGVAGALIGGVVGLVTRTDSWRPISVYPFASSRICLRPEGVSGVRLSIAF